MRVDTTLHFALALAVGLGIGCRGGKESTTPSEDFEDAMAGGGSASKILTEQERLDQRYGKRSELSARPSPEEKCEGSGADKVCKLVDPEPKLSAAYGVREFMTHFRWGMDPAAVLEQLKGEVKRGYQDKQTTDALAQDAQRKELEADLEELDKQHIRFVGPASKVWKATLIAKLFKDDANEEMVWFDAAEEKRYYFFAEGKMWGIGHSMSKRRWPGKTYEQIVKAQIEPTFGPSPTAGEERDQRSGMLVCRYYEWSSQDGERIRAYDLMEGHGAILLIAVNGELEDKLGARHPSNKLDPALKGGEDIDDVMRDSGLCYDENGDMIHDPERCKAQKK